jgi:hypothetical protein
MSKLTVELSLVPVDMGAKPEIPIVDLAIKKSKGTINVVGLPITTADNRRKLALKSENNPGIKDLWNFSRQTANFIFCVSCSLANSLALFSPLRWDYPPAIIEEERSSDSAPKFYPAQKVCIKKIVLEINEAQVLNIMERILQFRVSIQRKRSPLEENIIASINSYQLALISPSIFLRFVSLFHAFEKAVNADEDRRDKKFIRQATVLTGFKESEIEELHTFNKRIKHAFRKDTDDILTMENSIKNFSKLALRLKKATDNAILSRI